MLLGTFGVERQGMYEPLPDATYQRPTKYPVSSTPTHPQCVCRESNGVF